MAFPSRSTGEQLWCPTKTAPALEPHGRHAFYTRPLCLIMNQTKFYFLFLFCLVLVEAHSQVKNSGINIYYAFENNDQLSELEKDQLIIASLANESNLILIDSDIKFYDWKTQRIVLTESGYNKMRSVNHSIIGFTAILTLNDDPVYNFQMFIDGSSEQVSKISSYWKNSEPVIVFYFDSQREKCNKWQGQNRRNIRRLRKYVRASYYN